MERTEGGKDLHAAIVGSPNVNPGYTLAGNKQYPPIAEDYK
jgi:metallo-beta-lactamase class B